MITIIVSLIIITIVLIDIIKFTSFYVQLRKNGVRTLVTVTGFTYYNKRLKIRSKIPVFYVENVAVEPFVSMFDLFPYKEGSQVKIIFNPNNPKDNMIIDRRSLLTIYLLQSIHIILFLFLIIDSLKKLT